jgi:4-nitrophenyl phosphatase
MENYMLDLDALILDMDGVLWRESVPMPGLVPFFEVLRAQGIGFILATNNSTRTVKQFLERLEAMGVEAEPEQVLSSAYAAADHLLTLAPPGTRVYAIGEEGIRAALESRGFEVTASGAEYVVVGLDRGFNFGKLVTAMDLILDGAVYIGTNPDRTFPSPQGLRPGAGAILASVTAATGVEPIVVGKPGTLMFEQALARLGTRPERTGMVGDRLETDILGAMNAKLQSILVLSGVTTPEILARSSLQPDLVFDDIRALTAVLAGSCGP